MPPHGKVNFIDSDSDGDSGGSSGTKTGDAPKRHGQDQDDATENFKMTFAGRVNLLEAGLSKALAEYRKQAEDELGTFAQSLEELQGAHDLEVAKLRAENQVLREKCGMKPGQSTADKVLFQTTQAKAKGKPSKSRSSDSESDEELARKPAVRKLQSRSSVSSNRGDEALHVRRAKAKRGVQAPGGTWQSFVAWVPNGAALGTPEPWKTLTTQDQPDTLEMRHKRSSTNTVQPVIPGQPEDSTKDSDDESENSSKSGEDSHFCLLEIWQATAGQTQPQKTKIRASLLGDTESATPMPESEDDFPEERHCCVINPDSDIRIAWDLCSLLMVLYDCIVVPMMAFDLEQTTFLTLMDWFTRLFWTCDIGWSCITGYVLNDGWVEYRLKAILQRYIKTWLALDLFIVISDWATLGMETSEMGFSRIGRVFRIVRAVRLLRLVRMQEIIANITERIQSDNIHVVVEISKYFVPVMFLSHIAACGWWAVGVVDSETSTKSWVGVKDYGTSNLPTKYLVSLHWALTQFSGGMDEIVPINAFERFYAVTIGMLCFMFAVAILSTLTSSLTRQYIIGGSGARQMANLRKYLKQNHCPKNLTKRLCRNAKHAISGDLAPDAVELLNVISEPLKMEMHYEMYSRILSWSPFFFDLLQGEHNQLVRLVCHRAVSILLLTSGDVVFVRGEEDPEPKMYFVVVGELEYLHADGSASRVIEKSCLVEQALWIAWKHRGTLTAVSDVKMALLDSATFQDICRRYFKKCKSGVRSIKLYAFQYLADLNESASTRTDLGQVLT